MHAVSVLLTKDPVTNQLAAFQSDAPTARKIVSSDKKGCSAFIEGIADLDNAHFVTKFEMQELTERLLGIKFRSAPRDRVTAAKDLTSALLNKGTQLPKAALQVIENQYPTRTYPPRGQVTPCRKGTKLAQLIRLLEKGTTMSEMKTILGWEEQSVHTGMNWDLNKRKGWGYKVSTIAGVDIYLLIRPQDYKGPTVI